MSLICGSSLEQMDSARHHNTIVEVESSAESDGRSETALQMKPDRSKTADGLKKAVRCADCGRKFDGWRTLHQHKRKSCPKSSLQFLCRECKAFFLSKVELNAHVSTVHVANSCEKVHKTDNSNFKKKANSKSSSCSKESTAIAMKCCSRSESLKWKKLRRHPMSADDLKKRKAAFAYKAAKRGKLRKRVKDLGNREFVEVVMETCTVDSNPFPFTTSCAPDAQSFQFLCQSCRTVRFATYADLRRHEDWCARVRHSHGFLCVPCGRHYRNLGTLRRHADEYHKIPVSSEVKKIVGNPFQFSTTLSLDVESHPHVCCSCQMVCFASPTLLRRHEDWCGQCIFAKDGFKCDKCGRYFRSDALLERHAATDDCLKPEHVAGSTDDVITIGDTESESSESGVKSKLAPEAITHSVCPLCDVPFISQYEQQVHFMNVHSLTLAELKIKQPFERHSRRSFAGTQVTCLDCDLVFSSRLKLVQHKRVCTKKEKFREVVLPTSPAVPSSGTGQSTVTMSTGTSGKSPLTTPSGSKSGKTAGSKGSEISRGLLLNTAKVRDLIRHTGAKQLLLKPDGELLLLGVGDQKISTVNGKPVTTKIHRTRCHVADTRSSCTKDGSKPCSSEKSSTVASSNDDGRSLQLGSNSNQSVVSVSINGEDLETERCIHSENLKFPAENCKSVTREKNSGQAEVHLESSCCKIDATVGQQHDVCECPSKGYHHKSLETKSTSAAGSKTCWDVGERKKVARKRPLRKKVIDCGPKNRISAAEGHEVKNNVVEKEESMLPTKRRMSSPDTDVKATDVPAPGSSSQVKKKHTEPNWSEVDDGQQSLLEALQLVPVSAQLHRPCTVAARYHTRSSTHANVGIAEHAASEKGRYLDNSEDKSRSSKSTSLKVHANKQLNKQVTNEPVAQKTQTVEPIGDSLVRCVECKTVFRTIRQIIDHVCTGQRS